VFQQPDPYQHHTVVPNDTHRKNLPDQSGITYARMSKADDTDILPLTAVMAGYVLLLDEPVEKDWEDEYRENSSI
jgi:hypothetical protein